MKPLTRVLLVILVLLVGMPLLLQCFFVRVLPTVVGVKQVRFGGVGVVEKDYDTGFHLGIMGIHRWYYLPRNTHFLHFVDSKPGSVSGSVKWEGALEIRTKDNNETSIEVTVPYRIRADEAHLLVMKGLRESYQGRVKSTVEKVLRALLAELSSEQFQSTNLRLQRTETILPLLNQELAAFHVEADGILIRRVTFPQGYEDKLQDKQYLLQKANLDTAEAAVANEEKVTNSYERQITASEVLANAEWNKKVQEETSRYEVLIAETNAQANIYQSRVRAEADALLVTMKAEGQLALDQARALRDQLRNEALATHGGRIYLALQAAQNLKIPSITLNSNDERVPLLFNLDEMTRILIGDEGLAAEK